MYIRILEYLSIHRSSCVFGFLIVCASSQKDVYIHIDTHTHTHTYIYIYIYIASFLTCAIPVFGFFILCSSSQKDVHIYTHIRIYAYIYIGICSLPVRFPSADSWSCAPRPRKMCIYIYRYTNMYIYTHIHIHIYVCVYLAMFLTCAIPVFGFLILWASSQKVASHGCALSSTPCWDKNKNKINKHTGAGSGLT